MRLNDSVVCFWHRVQKNFQPGNKIEPVTGQVLRVLYSLHTTEQALSAALIPTFSYYLSNEFLVVIGSLLCNPCFYMSHPRMKQRPAKCHKPPRSLFAPLRRPTNLFLLVFLLNPYKYWLVFHGHLRDFYMVFEMLSSHIAFIFFFFFIDFSP